MKRFLLLLIAFLTVLNISAAETLMMGTTGKVSGRVTDPNTGEALPFVNVIIMGSSMGAASDIDGYYAILNVPPGSYTIKASAVGYNSMTVTNVKVNIDLTTSVDFELSDVSIELGQEVIVVAERPMIDKGMTASTAIVGEDMISELPVTEISDVLELQAGVVKSSDGQIHVRGGRGGQMSYQIDGVPITDSYDGSTVVDVNSSAVQELQLISGAFNAEYGQALSGVLNLVTKDGNNDFHGSVQAYTGDYASNRTDIFSNIDDINPLAIKNVEGSLSGPIIKDKLFFFANARYFENEGYFYGRRTYTPDDIAFEDPNSGGSRYIVTQSGNNEAVAMNPNEKVFAQGKLSYILFPGMKLSYNYIMEAQNYKDFRQESRLTPDNNYDRFKKSNTNIFSINHAISDKSFYTLSLSYYFKDYRHWLYEDMYTGDPLNPTPYENNFARQTPPYSFEVGGTQYQRFTRNTGTIAAKLDWVTQMTKEINLQFGGDIKKNRIYFHDLNLIPLYDENGQFPNPFNVGIAPLTSIDNDEYLREPIEASAYAQAKFEAFDMIFNLGVRFDYFDADSKVLTDPSDPNIFNPLRPSNRFNDLNNDGEFNPDAGETIVSVDDRMQYWYNEASAKTQLSPRIGIAFPISDRGVIHFSYGHFFQLPRYEYLYTNPEFELEPGSGNVGIFGNADLEPQKTVKGEIGLQQQIGIDMAVDVTVFFEDFRNLTGTQNREIVVFGGDRTYSQYANTDFGFTRGFIVSFTKQFLGGLATNFDYTYSVTKGNASNPADAREAILDGALPETFIAPLNWDQTHTINLSVAYSVPDDFGFSIIGNMFTGQPYTPSVNKNTRVTQNAFPRNSDIKPTIFNIDMRIYKDFKLFGGKFSVFAKVFNLLDFKNPTNVYDNSGDPLFTFDKLEAEKVNPVEYYNTLDEYYTNPGYFSAPRRVELGLSYFF